MYNDTYSRLDSLEDQNIALRKQLGEFGFFGPTYTTPRLTEIRDKIEAKITVREWKLINNMNLSYTPEQLKEVASLLNRLVDDGMFNNQPTPYYYNPYYDYGGNMYPPMGAGVIADPAITNELTPHPTTKKQIIISGLTERISVPTYSDNALRDHGTRIEIDVDDVSTSSLSYVKLRLVESINDKNVITISIPNEHIQDAYDMFKGHYDYTESNVLMRSTIITLIGSDIKYVNNIINCMMRLFAKIYGKDISEVNNDNPGLITAVEDDEEAVSNNESD